MLPAAPAIDGATHVHSGKVRDLYRIDGGEHDGRLLMVASDRISAYDFVLDTTHPRQGRDPHPDVAVVVRPALGARRQPRGVDRRARRGRRPGRRLRAPRDVPRGVRGPRLPHRHPASSTTTATARCAASRCPAGLQDGSRLPEPIFTPASKADLGDHDENVDYEAVVEAVGDDAAAELRMLTMEVYGKAHDLAKERGIILADTKLEFGRRPDGTTILADEVLTPDSSRFWPADRVAARPHPGVVRQADRPRLADRGVRLGPHLRRSAAAPARRPSSSGPARATSRPTSS